LSTSGTPSTPLDRIDAEVLFRAHAAFIAKFLARLGVRSGDADDLVQEVFLVAHKKGGYVPGSGQPRTWLAAIALNVARAAHAARSRRREASDTTELDRLAAHGCNPETALDARMSLARVQRSLDTLELEHCAAFVLYEIEGESCEAIATAFEVPIGTIYSRLHHARRRFIDAYSNLSRGRSQRPRLAGGT
jgi:RNA polymerase sigma-70 factor (ECF subfamily)